LNSVRLYGKEVKK